MAFSKLLLSNLIFLSISAVLGHPSSDTTLATDAGEVSDGPAYITFCRGSYPTDSCASYTMVMGACVDFAGDKAQYFKKTRSVAVAPGFTCSLHDQFNCAISSNPSSAVFLQSGIYDLSVNEVPNVDGRPIKFNYMAASYKCSLA